MLPAITRSGSRAVRRLKRVLLLIFLGLAGCEAVTAGSYSAEIRRTSYSDNGVFADAFHNVIYDDRLYAQETEVRQIIRIEVLVPYSATSDGVERWLVGGMGREPIPYLVRMTHYGLGLTYVSVVKDDGKEFRDAPILPGPAK